MMCSNERKELIHMHNYIVIVRDFDAQLCCPSDKYLCLMDRFFRSPVVSLDWENNRDKAIDDFDEKYRKYFSHFLHLNYELIRV